MEASFILARINKAREFKVTHGAINFDCVCPSQLDVSRASARAARDVGGSTLPIATYYLVLGAVRGWSGVTVNDIDPDAPADEKAQAAEFDVSLLEYWLARDSTVLEVLATECFKRLAEKEKVAGAAKKN